MPAQSDGTDPSKTRDAVRTLERLEISVRGPFLTLKQSKIYLVEGCVLTESELIAHHEGGKFSSDGVREFLSELRRMQISQDGNSAAAQELSIARRRSQRVMLRLDVLIKLEMPEGKPLQTHAFTVVVNAHGGRLESPFRMMVGQKITLVNPQTNKEVACHVVRVQRGAGEDFTIGFEFEENCPWFWPVRFPPLDWAVDPEEA
ncbi:MAG TPA: PilZ domain-containing protein [Candidatus Acidoferrum sp.]|nr:PilZ domain-containing protein [Candidatus Acidoferrum sp.]